uniref:Ig-like domain-containing protein n=1 Tax=Mastacembelus armatus TaxID=205130 RepID=A0A3Q3LMN4_9TELE
AHMTPLFISVLLAAMSQKDNVLQPEGDVTATEGEAVTLGCLYNSTSPTLFWYKQEENDFPKYMMKSFSTSVEKAPDFQKDRFNAEINKTSVPLKIQKLQLSDSAVYYCETPKLCTKTFGAKTTQYSTTSTRGKHTLLNFSGLSSHSLDS